jgi:hypothetical protein
MIYDLEVFTMKNQKTVFAIVAIVAAVGIVVSAATSNTAYAKINSVTRCDGKLGSCPGHSSDPGQGHDETTQNENPSGHAPPGQN